MSELASDPATEVQPFSELPVASKGPRPKGRIRSEPSDFKVFEELLFEPTDEGEHLLIYIEKINLTTHDVRRKIATSFGVNVRDVGYLGLKDKRSVAQQWFSVTASRSAEAISVSGVEILQRRRHVRKLRPSQGCRNRFELILRELDGAAVATESMRVVPNYFGSQRFGRDGRNVIDAMLWV